MRRLVAFLATLIIVLVGADFGLRIVAEYRTGDQLRRSLELSSRPSVSVGEFPFIPQLVSGSFPRVTVRTGHWTVNGVTLDRVRLTLRDVRASTRALLYGRATTITADRGDGEAVIKALDATLGVLGQEATFRIRFEGGGAVVTSDQLADPVRATVSLEGSALVIRPDSSAIPASLTVDLPQLIGGLRYTRADVVGSEALIAFVVARPRFDVAG
jgi:hypothetical protein